MKIIIFSASPNKDGLTAACAQAAAQGIQSAAVEAIHISFNDCTISSCQACDNGWGTCRTEHQCKVQDDFQAIHAQVAAAQGCVLVSPVYWGELSESAKAFMDRLRRCEASQTRGESRLFDKPVIAVAAAGGSGNGMITCLLSMERWIQHVQARTFDLIPVNRWSRTYKLEAIQSAGKAMATELVLRS